jgi:hypothetical protein
MADADQQSMNSWIQNLLDIGGHAASLRAHDSVDASTTLMPPHLAECLGPIRQSRRGRRSVRTNPDAGTTMWTKTDCGVARHLLHGVQTRFPKNRPSSSCGI